MAHVSYARQRETHAVQPGVSMADAQWTLSICCGRPGRRTVDIVYLMREAKAADLHDKQFQIVVVIKENMHEGHNNNEMDVAG